MHDQIHEVLLCDGVATVRDLLEKTRKHGLFVHLDVHAVQRSESLQIQTDENFKIFALSLSLRLLRPSRALLLLGQLFASSSSSSHGLHAYPELVHLRKVLKYELDRVEHVSALSRVLVVDVGKIVTRLLIDEVSQEQRTHRMLHALRHLHEILQNVLRGGLLARHVHRARDRQHVQSRQHFGRLLNATI